MKTLQQHIQSLIDAAPGQNKTERTANIAALIGVGRTHLYEILAGTRTLGSLDAAKALHRLGVPADILLK